MSELDELRFEVETLKAEVKTLKEDVFTMDSFLTAMEKVLFPKLPATVEELRARLGVPDSDLPFLEQVTAALLSEKKAQHQESKPDHLYRTRKMSIPRT
jgi:hypothetical protein